MKKISADVLTDVQIAILRAVKPGHVLHDQPMLRKLSELGAVKLHEHTGQTVTNALGIPVIASYIRSAETFEIEGVGVFRQEHIDGCFNPYLIRAE